MPRKLKIAIELSVVLSSAVIAIQARRPRHTLSRKLRAWNPVKNSDRIKNVSPVMIAIEARWPQQNLCFQVIFLIKSVMSLFMV